MKVLQTTGTLSHEAVETLQSLYQESLKQSPTSGNGYGFAVGAVLILALGIAALFVWRQKVQDRKDREGRAELSEQIQRLGLEYRAEIQASEARSAERLDRVENRIDSYGDKLDSHGNRLTAIEAKDNG